MSFRGSRTRPSVAVAVRALGALLVSGALGCDSDDDGGGPVFSPDDVVSGVARVGEVVTLEGTVEGLGYDTRVFDEGFGWNVLGHRWVLLRVTDTAGLTDGQAHWGVGARWPEARIRSREWRLPQTGDRIRVTGTVGTGTFGDLVREERFTLDPVQSFTVLSSEVGPLGEIGDSCGHDMDCEDDLLCGRTSRVCEVVPPAINTWAGDPPRGQRRLQHRRRLPGRAVLRAGLHHSRRETASTAVLPEPRRGPAPLPAR